MPDISITGPYELVQGKGGLGSHDPIPDEADGEDARGALGQTLGETLEVSVIHRAFGLYERVHAPNQLESLGHCGQQGRGV